MINIESLITSPDRKLLNLYRLVKLHYDLECLSPSLKKAFGDILYDMEQSDAFTGDLRHQDSFGRYVYPQDEIVDSRAVSDVRMASKDILLSTFLSDSQNELIYRINKTIDNHEDEKIYNKWKDFL